MSAHVIGRIKEAAANDFLRHNFIYFVGSLSVSFLNYLYYPVLGRLLPLEAFGELQVLVSLVTQMTIFFTVMTLVSTNVVSNMPNKTDASREAEAARDAAHRTVNELEKITLYIGFGLLVLVTVVSPLLQRALKFESALPFVIIGLVLLVGISAGFRTAYLRGKSNFLGAAIVGVLVATIKIVASAGLVLLGFKTAGAAGGILVAQVLGFGYAAYKARKLGFVRHKGRGARLDWNLLKPQASYAGLVLFVSLITTILYSADVTIVKFLFSPEVAGQYAGVATVSRIILFLTASFAVVLLSVVKLSKPPQENSKLLLRSLAMTLALGGPATLVFCLFPAQVVHLLFGVKYDVFTHLLPLLSLTMLMVSFCTLISNYHIALRHKWVMLYVGIGAIITTIMLLLNHQSPDAVVGGLAVGSGCMLAGLVIWTGLRAGYADKFRLK